MNSVTYRLATVLREGAEATLIDLGGRCYFLDTLIPDLPASVSVLDIVRDWGNWRPRLDAATSMPLDAQPAAATGLQFLAPITHPPKLICIGTNYHDHLREMHVTTLPEYPYGFMRPRTSLAGHGQPVRLPEWPTMVDWEAELGVVIGAPVDGGDPLRSVFGYTIINDLSARDWIESRPFVGIDWVMQKAWDHFQPTGPWLTPAAFVPDPQALAIELSVNGVVRQSSNTSEMIFGVADIIRHLSRIMTLEPGDIIATGTPAGVGFGHRPRISLAAGDEMVVTIEGLGEPLRNRMVARD